MKPGLGDTLRQAEHFLAAGNLTAAASACKQILAEQSEHERALEILANTQIQANAFGPAQSTLETLCRVAPNNPEWHLAAARCAWKLGAYDSAQREFLQAAQTAGPVPQYVIPLAQAQMSLGRPETAETTLVNLLDHQFDPLATVLLAMCRWNNHADNGTLKLLERAVQDAPQHALANYAYAAALHLANRSADVGNYLWPIQQDVQMRARWESLLMMCRNAGPGNALGTATAVRDAGIRNMPAGIIVECGVYYGASLRYLATRCPDRTVHGFDSFQGLPEDWTRGNPAGSYSTGGILPEVPANVTLHPGWFADTLPVFLENEKQPIALLHIDCDLYSSTQTALQALSPLMRENTILVFDDFFGYPGYEQHEYKAFQEFTAAHRLTYEWLGFSVLGREAALRILQIQ